MASGLFYIPANGFRESESEGDRAAVAGDLSSTSTRTSTSTSTRTSTSTSRSRSRSVRGAGADRAAGACCSSSHTPCRHNCMTAQSCGTDAGVHDLGAAVPGRTPAGAPSRMRTPQQRGPRRSMAARRRPGCGHGSAGSRSTAGQRRLAVGGRRSPWRSAGSAARLVLRRTRGDLRGGRGSGIIGRPRIADARMTKVRARRAGAADAHGI